MHDADINAVTIEKLKKAKSTDEERADSKSKIIIVSPKDAHPNLSIVG